MRRVKKEISPKPKRYVNANRNSNARPCLRFDLHIANSLFRPYKAPKDGLPVLLLFKQIVSLAIVRHIKHFKSKELAEHV